MVRFPRAIKAVNAFILYVLFASVAAHAEQSKIVVEKLSQSTVCDDLPAPQVSCELISRYAFSLPSDQRPERHMLVISGFRGNLEAKLNNQQLISQFGGRTDLLIRASPPIQFNLLAEQLNPGINDLTVAINSEAVMGPYPGSVSIFEENQGGEGFTNSLWNQIKLGWLADGIVFTLCLVALAISKVASQPRAYYCFATVCLCWLLGSVVAFLPKSFSTPVVMAMNLTSFIGGMLWAPLLLMIANLTVPRWIWALCFAVPASLYIVTWTVGDHVIVRGLMAVALVLIFVMALISVGLAIQRGRSYVASNAIWLGLVLIVLVLGISRITSVVTVEGSFPPVRSNVAFLAVTAIGLALVRRFLLDFVERKVQEERLHVAVNAAELEILRQVEVAQKQQSLIDKQAERQRLMGDLHDGVAGHLLTISALARRGNTSADLSEIRQISQAAIVDLRLIVDSLDEQARTFKACISGFHTRALQLAQSTGYALHCEVDADMPDWPISQAVALDFVRILQELINNAIRHSGGSQIELKVSFECDECVVINLEDNGTAAPKRLTENPGVGIRSMFRRAERIGGTLQLLPLIAGGVSAKLILNPDRFDGGHY